MEETKNCYCALRVSDIECDARVSSFFRRSDQIFNLYLLLVVGGSLCVVCQKPSLVCCASKSTSTTLTFHHRKFVFQRIYEEFLVIMIFYNLSLFLLLAASPYADAFVPGTRMANQIARATVKVKPLRASTLERPTVDGAEPTTWECDDELTECREVPACDEEACRTSLDVRIHGDWYDLSG